jgi:hypothetical protein
MKPDYSGIRIMEFLLFRPALDDDDDDSSKRIKLLIASSSSQKEEEIDLFSLIISQAPVVDRLIEFGINPAVLRRVTAKLFREALYLKDMEQLIAPVYADEEWANAIACSMLDRSDWLGLRREFCDEFALRGNVFGHNFI